MNKKTVINYLRKICVLCVIMVLMTGCTDPGQADAASETFSLSVVVGVHSNANEIPLSSDSIKNLLYDVSYTYGTVSFVNCDGDPDLFYETTIPTPNVSGLSNEKLARIAENYTSQLQEILVTAEAVNPEVDTLEAIRCAAQSLRGAQSNSDKMMLVLDSGLSTTGYLNFINGLLNVDPETIIEELAKENAIPDLNGISVRWCFCGETAAPQEKLSERQKQNLRDIWETILRTGGAESVEFTEDFSSNTPYSGLPEVSVVRAEEREIEPLEITVLDSKNVQFVGNEATFVDKERAIDALKAVADQLIAHPQNMVYIVGTTAGGVNEEFCQQLSEERAEAVRELLISMEVSASQMEAVGLGANDYWHKPDVDANGNQIEEIAAENRKVMIIDKCSDEAQYIFCGLSLYENK